jgi:hypothetical protein
MKIIMNRLLPLLLLCLLTASSQAGDRFTGISSAYGSPCASAFPVLFQADSNVVFSGTGPYTATVTDSAGTSRGASAAPGGVNFVTRLFNLNGLATGPGSVSISDDSDPNIVFTFNFFINGCPPSGVGVTIYGATTLAPYFDPYGRVSLFVLAVNNYNDFNTSPAQTVELDPIPIVDLQLGILAQEWGAQPLLSPSTKFIRHSR